MTYSEKDVTLLVDTYQKNPCLEVVDKLSVMLNKPRKSIIAKLSKEGVYIRKGYRTKTGEEVVTKLQLVRDIEGALDKKLPGLDKTPKTTLKVLRDDIMEAANLMEDTLEEMHARYTLVDVLTGEERSIKK
jgi:hypothetical protein